MDIQKIISTIRNLKEELPANNTGSQGDIAGFSAASTGPVAGTSPKLFSRNDSLLDQDYQTPGQSGDAEWRFSNVYPVQKLTDADVDNMVDASKEYVNRADNNRDSNRDQMKTKLENIIDMIRSLKEDKIIDDGKKLVNPKKNPLIKKEEMAAGGVPTNNASSGAIAGLPPDSPPVKKKKKYIYGGHGSRKMWLANKK
tara:strand:+ start:1780 stop:2373 length:594 start_codon:yes stop_codon:yes gene_type:complete